MRAPSRSAVTRLANRSRARWRETIGSEQSQGSLQVTHAEFAGVEHIQKPKARRVSNGLKEVGQNCRRFMISVYSHTRIVLL